MDAAIVVAIIGGVFTLAGIIVSATFGLIAARKARDAEREREQERKDRERVDALWAAALRSEREENARLRGELRERPRGGSR